MFVETLQLLDAVSRIASLGFEKSYREAVVLMIRSYLSKLSSIGSAESKTLPAEANTERVEVNHIPYGYWILIALAINNLLVSMYTLLLVYINNFYGEFESGLSSIICLWSSSIRLPKLNFTLDAH